MIVFWSSSPLSLGAQIEYLESARVESLKAAFEQAKVPQASDLNKTKWDCEMYGVSSRLQVERNLKLYYFEIKNVEQKQILKNRGAQIIKEYALNTDEVLGVNGIIKDHIRISGDGRLISRLDIESPKTKEKSRTLAISNCKRLNI